ncbi:MAG: hypothetical protein KDK12_02935 [Rhodobacteraceae bacterium]|nr:hypothetical protein [Paracoccaceae bacterium]
MTSQPAKRMKIDEGMFDSIYVLSNMEVIMDPHRLSVEVQKIASVSDKIRFLDRQGMARADIARFLGKRYQHVRNVLESDAAKAQPAGTPASTRADTAPSFSVAATGDGVTLATAVCARIGVEPGDRAMVTVKGDVIEIRSAAAVLADLKKQLRALVPPGTSLADELIADRRAEAARDDAEGRR